MEARKHQRALAALAAVLAIAGCGDGDDVTDEEAGARAAVDELLSSVEERDAAGVCARIQSEALAGLTEEQCVTQLEGTFGATGFDTAIGDYEITSVEIEGDQASATVVAGGEELLIPLVKSEGEWKSPDLTFGR